jgi:hypothetical protein
VGGKGWGDITETSKTARKRRGLLRCRYDQHGPEPKKRANSGFAAAAAWPDAKRYTDWREMLDKEASG